MSVVCSNVSSRGTARLLRPGGPPAWRTDIDTHKTTKGGLPRRDSWCSQKCPPHKVGLLACTVCARYLGLRAPLSARVWVDCSASPTRSAPVGHGHLSPGPWAPSRSGHGLRLGARCGPRGSWARPLPGGSSRGRAPRVLRRTCVRLMLRAARLPVFPWRVRARYRTPPALRPVDLSMWRNVALSRTAPPALAPSRRAPAQLP